MDNITLPHDGTPPKWLREDKKCPHCGQVTERVRGLTKQNLRRLIIPKWDLNEITITLLLIMIIVLALVYKVETDTCRNWLKPMIEDDGANCINICDEKCSFIQDTNKGAGAPPITNLTLNEFNVT
jgi:hypothetical protein